MTPVPYPIKYQAYYPKASLFQVKFQVYHPKANLPPIKLHQLRHRHLASQLQKARQRLVAHTFQKIAQLKTASKKCIGVKVALNIIGIKLAGLLKAIPHNQELSKMLCQQVALGGVAFVQNKVFVLAKLKCPAINLVGHTDNIKGVQYG